jgi:prepilin-type N-terminal cleavage/methylation domain-containing protein
MPNSSLVYTSSSFRNHSRGFTLVELIVAISIVGLLSAIGLVSYLEVTKNSRDQIRMRDLQSLKGYLEIYRNSHGEYPNSLKDAKLQSIVKEFPTDPKQKSGYYFQAFTDSSMNTPCISNGCVAYVLCAQKETNASYPKPLQCPTSYGMGVSEK